jgi:hypothetical protein
MKTLTRACLLALPLLAAPSLAYALPSMTFDAGFGCHFNSCNGKGCAGGCVAGPWYTYFPYNAYFQTPAPVYGWPYFPPQAAMPVPKPQSNQEPAMPQQPQSQSRYFPPERAVQPVGYFTPAPTYWYGK